MRWMFRENRATITSNVPSSRTTASSGSRRATKCSSSATTPAPSTHQNQPGRLTVRPATDQTVKTPKGSQAVRANR